jgi:hypothetical protein
VSQAGVPGPQMCSCEIALGLSLGATVCHARRGGVGVALPPGRVPVKAAIPYLLSLNASRRLRTYLANSLIPLYKSRDNSDRGVRLVYTTAGAT